MKKPLIKIKDCLAYMDSIDYNFVRCSPLCPRLYSFKKRGLPYKILGINQESIIQLTIDTKTLRRFVKQKRA